MRLTLVQEGRAKVRVPDLAYYGHPNHAPVFFNPQARPSRDVSTLLLSVLPVETVLDGMAATGIRGIRYALEAEKSVVFNDINPRAVELIQENVGLNNISAEIFQRDVRVICLENSYDAVDIDPFGTPSPFLPDAVLGVRNRGYLLVTATDPGPLSGKNKVAALRKYGVFARMLQWKEELAVRILLFAIFHAAGMNERGIIPVASFVYKNHVRVIVQLLKKPSLITKNAKNIGFYGEVGPLWLGPLHNPDVVSKAADRFDPSIYSKDAGYYFQVAPQEIEVVGFYDVHQLAKEIRLARIPPIDKVVEELKGHGFDASRTVFRRTGIKTTAKKEDVLEILKTL